MRWQKEINSILGSVSNDVLLLFKTLEWLRAIEGELGAPLNTVNIIANYCTKENTGRIERWIINFKAWLYSFLISLMSHLFPN